MKHKITCKKHGEIEADSDRNGDVYCHKCRVNSFSEQIEIMADAAFNKLSKEAQAAVVLHYGSKIQWWVHSDDGDAVTNTVKSCSISHVVRKKQ